ncbi:NAD(P)/FAD-dependent oxidoreductase [Arthrobacter sp. H5]|uniref:flavin-containing monooxygenase n=1 Tax=Arthrobacter sp. H5 TaxID=1267973 RepID=UPI0004B5AB2F|nr:NAD(P)/FAD-dependent oxidoreductase [Arthrobacter sp. H5]
MDFSATRHVRVAIIGAGFSGLGAAIRLTQEGETDFLVFERAQEIGGTWRENTYPGSACDVMSLLYSYSFAPNPNWSTTFGKQPEILQYLRDCADRFGVRPHIRFEHDVVSADWDEEAHLWRIDTSGGGYTAQILATGTGYLSDPVKPAIEGLDSFTGELFHSSGWNHGFDLTGKRIAVVGNGASAVQFIPKVQEKASALDLYQRTPAWVAPKPDREIPGSQLWLRRNVPGYQGFRRNFNMWGREIVAFMMGRPKVMEKTLQGAALKHLHASIQDPVLRDKLTPAYTAGCKRILFSNNFYPALNQPNVSVVTDGIARIHGNTIESVDGTRREVDAIILATGFKATDRPIAHRIRGNNGLSLADAWDQDMSAYAGTTVAGFPNLFMFLGPNTALGHSSQTVMIEAQITYLLDALKVMDRKSLASVSVRPAVQKAYNTWLDGQLQGTVWNSGGCQSWYLDKNGRNPSIWPTYTWTFRNKTKTFDTVSYHLTTTDELRAGKTHIAAGRNEG